ncbi:alpha-1,3-galactosidase-related protein [Segetibacter koreensis]|uniref:alpha-1,3-galactosidase-related protein n=1 Tax=Segetibacter koreensis TaxID=398037 RepID=UPI0003639260|nr:right-handed parallel beta-helix repeat-containing protein [Segetibacter koreensis]
MNRVVIKYKVLFLFLAMSLETICFSQDTVRITDYGYVAGSRVNVVPYVLKALNDCKTKKAAVLVFPKGRYDFWPQYVTEKLYYESNTDVIPLRRCPILIEGFNKLEINCNNADFIFHDRMQPFTIDSSKNITIRNVNIDWDIPLTAQAEIANVSDDYIDLSINAYESPYIIEKTKLFFVGEGWKSEWWGAMEFDKNTKQVSPQTGDAGCMGDNFKNYKAIELKKGVVRLQYTGKHKPLKGNWLVLRHSARDHAGTFIINSRNIVIENMNMYHCAGLGILSQYSGDLHFKKVNVVPNAAKNRILSGHDDGTHFSNCSGQITIDSCRFLSLMDDPVNVHGTSVRIIKKLSDTKLLCRFMHEQSIGFVWARQGETIGFIENEAMNTVDTRKTESIQFNSPEEFEISFSKPVPTTITEGDALENLTCTPDVLIKNSFFGSNRARGILISTPGKVVIENNVFESSGSAILIPGDANGWYESGAVKDVTIRNNIFNDPCLTSLYQFCDGIISIYPEIPRPDINKPFHRNIHIDNNVFHPFDYSVLYAKSVEGLYFNNNNIIRSTRYKRFHYRKYMFTFEYCKKVEVSNNHLQGDVLGKNIKLVATSKTELHLKKQQDITVGE